MDNFTAIDFETANWLPVSICQVGLVRYEGGKLVAHIDQLVRPPGDFYHYKNIEVHGIRPDETMDAPTFDQVWPIMQPFIENEVVVAHNSSFDFNCMKAALHHYGMEMPPFTGQCTRRIFRRGLSYLSKKYHIPLNHHNALSDANACAQLYLRHLAHQKLPRTGSLFG